MTCAHSKTHRTEKGLSYFLKKVLERILKSSRVRFYTFLTRTVPMIPMIEAASHDKLIPAVVPKSKVIIALIPRLEMQQTQTFGIC